MRPQPGTPHGESWEAGARRGWGWARDEIERLRAALEFYARPVAYQGDNMRNDGADKFTAADAPYIQSVGRDGGNVARAALGHQQDQHKED